MEERMEISERVLRIIEEYKGEGDFVSQTHQFVRAVLGPESVGEKRVMEKEIKRYDMQYRYDHTLRVAAIGREIARAEGIAEEPLVMACLLHDVGYPECKSFEELGKHPAYGAEIAGHFLKKIGYDAEMSKSICKAILIHDRYPCEGEDATVLEKSVRDAGNPRNLREASKRNGEFEKPDLRHGDGEAFVVGKYLPAGSVLPETSGADGADKGVNGA